MKCGEVTTTCIAREGDDCMEHLITDTPNCPSRVPITNADRIRSMSDKELAEYIFDLGNGSEYCYGHCAYQDDCNNKGFDDNTCIKGVIDWLKQPLKEAPSLINEDMKKAIMYAVLVIQSNYTPENYEETSGYVEKLISLLEG